jgi:acyl-CoA synthetase (NDP forming)
MPSELTVDTARVATLLNPRNVVLVGASERAENWSGRVWHNLRRFGFPGGVFPLNPARDAIWGARCYRALRDLPEPPDHLALFVPADVTLEVLESGAAAGARSATLYAAGFGEGGDPAGRRRLALLQEFGRRNDIAIAGPNCMGVAAAASRFCTFADENLLELAEGPVAVIAQSGALCSTINRGINDVGLRAAYLLSCGNQVDLTIGDYIDHLGGEPALRVILCYIEQVHAPERFFEASRRAAAAGKTIVAVKIGRSEAGRKAALAHTGTLAGALDVFDAFAREAGIVRVDTIEDAITAVTYLARLPRPRGRRVAVVTNSGAVRNLTIETAARAGLALAEYDVVTAQRLAALLGPDVPSNPLDTKRTLPPEAYVACIEALAASADHDGVLIVEELPDVPGVARKLVNLRALAAWAGRRPAGSIPVAVFTPLPLSETDYGRALRQEIAPVPVMKGMDSSLRVFGAMAMPELMPTALEPTLAPRAPREGFQRLRERPSAAARPGALNEPDSKALLADYGIPVQPEAVVDTAKAAVAAATRIGFPVVLKGVSAAVPHKSDAGLVILDLGDAAAVERAARTLLARADAAGIALEGMLVARQIPKGIETVLGIHRDVELGPVVMFGMGGAWLELFHDVAFGTPGLDRSRARALVQRTRVNRLLQGYRGSAPADVNILIEALVSLGQMARDLPDIVDSVDINPFIVCPVGQGAWAADCLVVLGAGGPD